jgi:hypothetical protein
MHSTMSPPAPNSAHCPATCKKVCLGKKLASHNVAFHFGLIANHLVEYARK